MNKFTQASNGIRIALDEVSGLIDGINSCDCNRVRKLLNAARDQVATMPDKAMAIDMLSSLAKAIDEALQGKIEPSRPGRKTPSGPVNWGGITLYPVDYEQKILAAWMGKHEDRLREVAAKLEALGMLDAPAETITKHDLVTMVHNRTGLQRNGAANRVKRAIDKGILMESEPGVFTLENASAFLETQKEKQNRGNKSDDYDPLDV